MCMPRNGSFPDVRVAGAAWGGRGEERREYQIRISLTPKYAINKGISLGQGLLSMGSMGISIG